MSDLTMMLAQVQEEEIEYQPGYWVWQMEVEIRDAFVAAARLVADPNIEAMARLIRIHWEDVEAGPTNPFTSEEVGLSEQLAGIFLAAALTPGEPQQ